MSPSQLHFTTLRPIPPHPITVAKDRILYATGIGDPKVEVPNSSSATAISLKDAFYAPDMTHMSTTVVSVGKIAGAGDYCAYVCI